MQQFPSPNAAVSEGQFTVSPGKCRGFLSEVRGFPRVDAAVALRVQGVPKANAEIFRGKFNSFPS